MAVHLRFQRQGTKHRPFYHLVATDSRKALGGAFIEKLGYYDPKDTPPLTNFKQDRIQYWFDRGAQLSHAVATLLKKQKITLERAKTATRTSKKSKA